MPWSSRHARDADPPEPWARGTRSVPGPLVGRSFRNRRIPTRPDVPPGGASSDGGQWMLRSRRPGQVPLADPVMDRRRNHPGRSVRFARRGVGDGPMDRENSGKGPISLLLVPDRMVIAVLARQGHLRPCMVRIWPTCGASAGTTAPAASLQPDPLPTRHAFGAWRRSCAPPPTWRAWPVRPAVEGVHTAGMIRPRRGHELLRPRLRMSSSRSADCGAVRRCSLQTPQGRQPQVDDRPAHVAHFTAAVYRGCSRRRFG